MMMMMMMMMMLMMMMMMMMLMMVMMMVVVVVMMMMMIFFSFFFCSHSCVLFPGPSLSTMMVNAGLTTFKKIEDTNPREIEMVGHLK